MSRIRKSAKRTDCQIRIPGICNFDEMTTVHAHKNGGGMAMKNNDILGARSCSSCHDAIDGRLGTEYSREQLLVMFYEGIFRTQLQLIDEGLIEVK